MIRAIFRLTVMMTDFAAPPDEFLLVVGVGDSPGASLIDA